MSWWVLYGIGLLGLIAVFNFWFEDFCEKMYRRIEVRDPGWRERNKL